MAVVRDVWPVVLAAVGTGVGSFAALLWVVSARPGSWSTVEHTQV